MTTMSTIERTRGRWREILLAIGIETRFLTGKHGPCPLCGGKDRFRWDDKEGGGSYFCQQCRPGSGLTMVQKFLKVDFPTACRRVDEIIGTGPPPARSAPARAVDDQERRRQRLRQMLDGAGDDGVVDRYLRSRGLKARSDALRGHAALAYFDDERKLLGRFPAMVAAVTGPDGSLQSVHRTYIGDVPERKKLAPPVDTVKGAAVRLFPATAALVLAEGIETTIAAHELSGWPAWATITAGGMEAFEAPPGLSVVHVYADNDRNFVGQRAAYVLAQRLARDIQDVAVMVPPEPDTDWLDVLIERRAAA